MLDRSFNLLLHLVIVLITGYAYTIYAQVTQVDVGSALATTVPVAIRQIQPPSEFRKVSFELDLGGLQPRGELKGQFKSTFSGGGHFGLRFHKYAQLDGGVNIAIGAANISETVTTTLGLRKLRDTEVLVPLGGRFIFPLMNDQIHLALGGGGVLASYSESVQARANEIITCLGCRSRTGSGSYGLAQIKFFDSSRRFGIGITSRYYQVKSQGSSFNSNLSSKSKDGWLQIGATLSFHF